MSAPEWATMDCGVLEDAELVTVHTRELPLPSRCCECGGDIPAGVQHWAIEVLHDGAWSSDSNCTLCWSAKKLAHQYGVPLCADVQPYLNEGLCAGMDGYFGGLQDYLYRDANVNDYAEHGAAMGLLFRLREISAEVRT